MLLQDGAEKVSLLLLLGRFGINPLGDRKVVNESDFSRGENIPHDFFNMDLQVI